LDVPVVTDFAAGAGGDRLDLSWVIDHFTGWDGSVNPFAPAAGFLRLVQNGTSVELQRDIDGGAGADYGWDTILTFQNTTVAAFSADNFLPGFSPARAAPGGAHTAGTGAAETLAGPIGAALIEANGGADTVHAGAGCDVVLGGAGADQLF